MPARISLHTTAMESASVGALSRVTPSSSTPRTTCCIRRGNSHVAGSFAETVQPYLIGVE